MTGLKVVIKRGSGQDFVCACAKFKNNRSDSKNVAIIACYKFFRKHLSFLLCEYRGCDSRDGVDPIDQLRDLRDGRPLTMEEVFLHDYF